MNKFALIALVGAASATELHATYDGDAFYGDGNAGKRNPKETLDAYWHAAHNAADADAFHRKAALQGAFVPSSNKVDTAPTYHNNGGYVQQNRHDALLAQAPSHWGPNGTPIKNKDKIFKLWGTGNGGGNEHQDVFWDMGHLSKNATQFNKWARYPDLLSENKKDKAPKGFNGFYAQMNHIQHSK